MFQCAGSGEPVAYRGGQCLTHQPATAEAWLRHDTPPCDLKIVPRRGEET
jgi:hypothetical protein